MLPLRLQTELGAYLSAAGGADGPQGRDTWPGNKGLDTTVKGRGIPRTMPAGAFVHGIGLRKSPKPP